MPFSAKKGRASKDRFFFMLRKRPLYSFQKIYIAGLQLLIYRTKRSVIFFSIRTEGFKGLMPLFHSVQRCDTLTLLNSPLYLCYYLVRLRGSATPFYLHEKLKSLFDPMEIQAFWKLEIALKCHRCLTYPPATSKYGKIHIIASLSVNSFCYTIITQITVSTQMPRK